MKLNEQNRQLGIRLSFAREIIAKKTQEEVAKKLGMRRSTISKLERNEQCVSAIYLFNLSELYGIPLEWFFWEGTPGDHQWPNMESPAR